MNGVFRHAAFVTAGIVALAGYWTGCSRETRTSEEWPSHDAAKRPAVAAIARGRVDVEGGLLQLTMPVECRLVSVAVQEGDRVTRGQILASGDTTAARIQANVLEVKLEQTRAQQRILESRLELAQARAQRLTEAASAGAGDGQSADDAHDGVLQLSTELENVRAAGKLDAAELGQVRYQLSKYSLRAPIAAQVIRAAAQPGMNVSPQSGALFTLLPQSLHIIRAEVNGPSVASVRVGMHATILSDDEPQLAVGSAHVLRVAPTYGLSALEGGPDQHVGDRSVQCVLAVDGDAPLRVGQRVVVRFQDSAPRRDH